MVAPAEAAELAFARLDRAGLAAARADLDARVPCASEPLSPAAMARVHRAMALASFVDGNLARTTQALAGLFAAEPGHQIPSSVLAEQHPIRDQVPAAMLALRGDVGVPVPALDAGWIEVDGLASKTAPTQRAAILQEVDGQGKVVATHYWWPDTPSFDWVVLLAPTVVVSSEASPTPSPWAKRAPLLAATGATVIAAAVLTALAVDGRAEFDAVDPLDGSATDDERAALRTDLESLQAEVNTLTYLGYGAAGLGLGLGAVVVVTW